MEPFFTFITPLFNQKEELKVCVASLKAQTCPDFEVIAVDDGSTDGSAEEFEALTKGDDRFHLIRHEKNQSVLMVRKTGIGQAKGRYLLFVDADDYVEQTMLERLKDELTREPADVLMYGMVKEPSGEAILPYETDDPLEAILTAKTHPTLMRCAFARAVYEKAYPFIRDGYCNMAEDYYISTILYTFAESFRRIPDVFYHYVTGGGMSSGTQNLSVERLKRQAASYEFALSAMEEFLSANDPEHAKLLPKTRFDIVSGTVWQYGGADTSWAEFLRYLAVLNTEKNEAVMDWACREFIPMRASMGRKKEEEI